MKLLFLNALLSAAILTTTAIGQSAKNIATESKPNTAAKELILNNELDVESLAKQSRYDGLLGKKASLNTFHDGNSLFDDFSYWPNLVDNQGIINGTINIHTRNEKEELSGAGDDAGNIDKDWYRFSLNEKRRYTFSFTAPNSNYYFNIYRFADLEFGGIHQHEQQHFLVATSRTSGWNFTTTLVPATYFILVSALNESSVVSYQNYQLSYTSDDNIGELTYLPLGDSYTSNYDVILWESDKKPVNVDRWDENRDPLLITYGTSSFCRRVEGYIDPIFMTNTNWRPVDNDGTNGVFVDNKLYLDSITYITSKKALNAYCEALDTLRVNIINKDIEQRRVKSLEGNETKVWDFAKGAFCWLVTVAGYFYGGPYVAGVELGIFVFDTIELAAGFKELIEFKVDNDDIYAPTIGSLCSNLRLLSDQCYYAANDYDTDHVVKIPKYGYVRRWYGDTDKYTGVKVYEWVTSSFLPYDYNRTTHFIAPKTSCIQRTMTDDVVGASASGTIKLFSDYLDFAVYTGFNPEDFKQMDLVYSMEYDNNQYWLKAHNPTSSSCAFTYSNCDTTESEGNNFNLKANGYVTETVESHHTLKIPLGNRNYTYVREKNNNYVTRLTLDGSLTRYSEQKQFGKEYLKISIVSKSGTKWTIRVRNLTGSSVKMYYNSKMCNLGDGKNWTGLKDWKNNYYTISNNGYKDVAIYENWFATSIAVSYVKSSKRYISYADNLNNSKKTLSYKTNTVNA